MDTDDRAGWWAGKVTGQPRPASFMRRWPVLGAVFYLPGAVPTAQHGGPLLISLLVVYGVCYLTFPFLLLPHQPRWVRLTFATAMVVVGLAVLAAGATVYILLYTTVVIALSLESGWVLLFDGLTIAGAGLLVLLHAGLSSVPGDFGTVVGVTSAMFFLGRLSQTVRRLRRANEEIAALAVGAERERLARDLHDILGHSLTTIAVKAGLARRLIESAADPERAVTEIREVEGLARSALSDVRATVSEYREVSLSAELVGARTALRAAEIEADLPSAVDNVRPELQTTFGYVLREAVTNVLRHSGASRVKVRLGRNWLEITDNGRGVEPGVAGNGLRGLEERLAQVGGTLQVRARPGEGFGLRAEVLADRPVEVS
ncbi:two-component system sensor histidine kinase DesK [Amycolatopsis endophytica]|uniref:Two-component system sensor histidine kinase DesK n=1 Tax=Amycolatopsis endophytica TaxID=860233 RepID=A0A853BFY1_9PSEU|nr:sensor histidine kinase [Amycolatopsis endophytica]NYI93541.1 two-component system sensor histidine kinase DesK [Amycolatopsis endophytica]